jgi:hypothetical protein
VSAPFADEFTANMLPSKCRCRYAGAALVVAKWARVARRDAYRSPVTHLAKQTPAFAPGLMRLHKEKSVTCSAVARRETISTDY